MNNRKKSLTIQKTVSVIIMMSILLITSCTFDIRDPDDQDLSTLLTLNRGVSSFMSILASDSDLDSEERSSSSRAINSSAEDIEETLQDIYDYLHDDDAERTLLTPKQVFEKYKTGDEIAEVPDSASSPDRHFLENFYGDTSMEAYFSLTPASAPPSDDKDYYVVNLYIYDRSSLYLDYEYESYLVAEDSWSNLDEDGDYPGYLAMRSVYYDGSYLDKTLEDHGPDSSGDPVYNIEVPEITDGNLDSYTFAITTSWSKDPELTDSDTVIDDPAVTQGNGNYYSKTYGSGKVQQEDHRLHDYEVISYYAEYDDKDKRTGVSYTLQPDEWGGGNYLRTVTRSSSTYADGQLISREIKSVTSHSYKGSNPWQTDTQEIAIGTTGSTEDLLLTYSQVDKIFSGSSVSGTPWHHSQMTLTEEESAGVTKRYTGTYQVFWSNWIENYSVEYEDGEFTLRRLSGSSRRSLFGDTYRISLEDLRGNGSFSIQLPGGGEFSGRYIGGAFVGTYTAKGGSPQDITIRGGSIILDGNPYHLNGDPDSD